MLIIVRTIILACAILFSFQSKADEWEKVDYALATAAVATLAVDWGQTRYLAKNPCANVGGGTSCTDPYRETGLAKVFIGEHPTTGKVDRYFVGAIAGTLIVSNLLPKEYRRMFLGGMVVIELYTIHRNRSIGLMVDF